MPSKRLSQLSSGGPVLGWSKDGRRLYINRDDTHTLVLGATRSGKTRNVVLPSICTMALAGESIIAMDPKAELFLYTYPLLERLGYEVITIDFKNPALSNRYNFLQPVVDAINAGDIPKAVTNARDVAAILAPDTKGERIWTDGERSTLSMGSLAVTTDNATRPEFQNLANCHQFIANMCKPVGGTGPMPILRYLTDRPEGHPAKVALGISEIAPSRMRGSFYTSALVSLDLFTDPAIHSMTATTDFDPYTTGEKKRAIFIILPDHKSTYYALASLFIYQQYQMLVEYSDRHGNRLPRRVNFVCDEFGNFVKIPDFDKMITVSGGRGIRFHLFLQDFNQLDEKYGDKVGKTIRSNCETWIYLQSDDDHTREELSRKLGKYTVKSPSQSGSSSNTGSSTSASFSLTGRDLLTPAEISKIQRPYQLLTSRADPAIMYAPDVSYTPFQTMLGLGDKAYNKELIIARNARRPPHPLEVHYWGIWNTYQRLIKAALTKGKEE